uniref:Uncharacterized protein n=2 Tax=Rubinisphaera brasiliensis TaxID=119 RepID=F0SHI6_RUBBR|nr:hypothetical protein Plabr_0801 [Rubinisphaera brasiliensis DSM 5305]
MVERSEPPVMGQHSGNSNLGNRVLPLETIVGSCKLAHSPKTYDDQPAQGGNMPDTETELQPPVPREEQPRGPRTAAVLAHLFQFWNFFGPGLGLVLPAILLFVRKDSDFIQNHSRVAINGALTFSLCFYCGYYLPQAIPSLSLPGTVLVMLSIVWLGGCVGRAFVIAGLGRPCRYPLAIPFLHVDWQQDDSPGSETI